MLKKEFEDDIWITLWISFNVSSNPDGFHLINRMNPLIVEVLVTLIQT